VEDERGVCPEGWNVPTDDDYTVLSDYLGGNSLAGGKMKECTEGSCPESYYLRIKNVGATNESGFTGLPGSCRYSGNGYYSNMGDNGYFWSSTEYFNIFPWYRILYYNTSDFYRYYGNKRDGFSVRCIRD